MKFRTEIEILPYDRQLSYDDRLLALGSCFATEIGRRMAEAKFRIAVNPSGVLFNPLSIVRTLRRYRDGRPVAKEELAARRRKVVPLRFPRFASGRHGGRSADAHRRRRRRRRPRTARSVGRPADAGYGMGLRTHGYGRRSSQLPPATRRTVPPSQTFGRRGGLGDRIGSAGRIERQTNPAHRQPRPSSGRRTGGQRRKQGRAAARRPRS